MVYQRNVEPEGDIETTHNTASHQSLDCGTIGGEFWSWLWRKRHSEANGFGFGSWGVFGCAERGHKHWSDTKASSLDETNWLFWLGSCAGRRWEGADCFLSSLLRWATRERWCRFLKLVLLVMSFDRCPRPGPGGCGLGWDCQKCLCCVYSATLVVVPDLLWSTDYIRVSV